MTLENTTAYKPTTSETSSMRNTIPYTHTHTHKRTNPHKNIPKR